MHLLDAKSFKYASLQAAAHLQMQQFKILLSNKARHQVKVHSGFKHLQTTSSLCTQSAPPSFLRPTQPESSGTMPKLLALP